MDKIKIKPTPFRKGKEILKNNPQDKVYTPDEIAKDIIKSINDKYSIKGIVLDPCRGKGAFYNNFPNNCKKDYCEIDEGKDFFEYDNKVNWIISNPPYSIFEDFLKHSMELAENIVFLIPVNKITSSGRRVGDIAKWGMIPYIKFFKGSECGFKFGFAVGAVYFKKDYKGDIKIELSDTLLNNIKK